MRIKCRSTATCNSVSEGLGLAKAASVPQHKEGRRAPTQHRLKGFRGVCPAEIHPQHITSPSTRRRGALADHSAIFAELSTTIFNFTYSQIETNSVTEQAQMLDLKISTDCRSELISTSELLRQHNEITEYALSIAITVKTIINQMKETDVCKF